MRDDLGRAVGSAGADPVLTELGSESVETLMIDPRLDDREKRKEPCSDVRNRATEPALPGHMRATHLSGRRVLMLRELGMMHGVLADLLLTDLLDAGQGIAQPILSGSHERNVRRCQRNVIGSPHRR